MRRALWNRFVKVDVCKKDSCRLRISELSFPRIMAISEAHDVSQKFLVKMIFNYPVRIKHSLLSEVSFAMFQL